MPAAPARAYDGAVALNLAVNARGSLRLAAASLARVLVAVVVMLSLQTSAAQAGAADGSSGTPRVDAASIATGRWHGCVIVETGSVRCWGYGQLGQLAQGDAANIGDTPGESTVPVDLGPGRSAIALSAGAFGTCAILDTGVVRCWGYNGYGQLAQGNVSDIGNDPGETTVPVDLGPGRRATAIASGDAFNCAILDTGVVRCWGRGSDGSLAQGNESDIGNDPGETTVPVDLGPGRTAVAIAAGTRHACAILDNGGLRCWGSNGFGELAQGDMNDIGDQAGESTVPVDLGAGRTAIAVTIGGQHTCAVLDTRAVRCWGDGSVGQLAQGSPDRVGATAVGPRTVAVDLGPGQSAAAVVAGAFHTCAIRVEGTVRCWGYNADGQLATGSTQNIGDQAGESTVPVDLGTGRTAIAIALSQQWSCFVNDARQVRCLGSNLFGALGQGSTIAYGTAAGETLTALPPIQLGGLRFGRDSDGDGARDAVDQCPGVVAATANGCAAPVPTPTPTTPPAPAPAPPTPGPTPTPTPVPQAEALLAGKTITLAAILKRSAKAKRCPARATATVKLAAGKLRITGRANLTVSSVTIKGKARCKATGTLRLNAAPPTKASVRVTITGKGLTTRRVTATR